MLCLRFEGHLNCRKEILVRWVLPWEGWVRLNTDGVLCGNPVEAGVGGKIHRYRGEIHKMFAFNC